MTDTDRKRHPDLVDAIINQTGYFHPDTGGYVPPAGRPHNVPASLLHKPLQPKVPEPKVPAVDWRAFIGMCSTFGAALIPWVLIMALGYALR